MQALARFLLLSAVAAPFPGFLTAQSCRAADYRSSFMLNEIKNLVTNTEPHLIEHRQRLGIPAVDTAQIALVTDTGICNEAVLAYNAGLPRRTDGRQPLGSVYVVRLGAMYVVLDPTDVAGEWAVDMIIESTYTGCYPVTGPE